MIALESEAPLIVYVDIKSPYAFVAIQPILALEAELDMQFDWRPLTLDIPSYLGSAKKKEGKVVASSGRNPKTWNAIRYAYGDARRYVERQGHILKGTEKIWDSSIANIGILWVMQNDRAKLGEYFDAVYPPFWRRELDIEDVDVVKSCFGKAGVSADGFGEYQSGVGRQEHDALQPQFHSHGIYGVPTFVLGEDILFGREHIPFLRWRLSGQNGPAPDIAYEIETGTASETEALSDIDVYIDFKSPTSYLALKPALALAEKHDLTIHWKPYRTSEQAIAKAHDNETVGESHRRVRAQSQQNIHLKYAALQESEMHFPDEPGTSDLALGVLASLSGDRLPFIKAAFHAYWVDNADLNSSAIVSDLLDQAVGQVMPLETEALNATLTAEQTKAEELAIVGAPAFVVGEKLFIGREHLPWIEEIIMGKN